MSSSPVEYSIAPSAARDVYRDRRPPYSEDAEQAVLSAMLMDQDAVMRAAEYIDDTMFYAERHRRIYRAMVGLTERGIVVDPLTLSDELARRGELESSGGKDYLGFLVDVVPTAANVEYHARIVREKSMLRRLIEASTTIVSEAYEARQPVGELVDHAEQLIFQISQQQGKDGFRRIKELLWDAMEKVEELLKAGGAITGVPSGFHDLDQLTQGFQPSDLVIVAARPSMGKTAFVLNVASNAALEHNIPVAVFSLEMSKESLVTRMLASEGRVDAQRLRSGKLSNDDYSRLGRAAGLLANAPIWIDDSPGLTVLEVRSRSRRLKAEHDVKMIIIDYLQLLNGPSDSESRQQEISYISRSLKILAKELAVPVIALSQLSRAPEQRTGDNKRPQLSDLRESGAIEQDADVVMFLYRPEYYMLPEEKEKAKAEGNPVEGIAEVIVGKQRNGPTDVARLFFHKMYTRFENFSPRLPQ
ncbi:MAG: replicative DNA helicase [Gemmatimonadaceae bacterium]